MITPELAEFVESGIATMVGTRDAQLRADAVRGVGARVLPGGTELEVLVPVANAAQSLANLRDNGRIAVVFARGVDHRSIQLKGVAVEVREGGEAERQLSEDSLHRLSADWAQIGVPSRFTLSLTRWPNVAIRVRVEEIYVQTPGPGAGASFGGDRAAAPEGGRR